MGYGDGDGLDTVTGMGDGFHAAYVVRNGEPPAVCRRGEPLSYLGTDVQRMVSVAGDRWGSEVYGVDVREGVI